MKQRKKRKSRNRRRKPRHRKQPGGGVETEPSDTPGSGTEPSDVTEPSEPSAPSTEEPSEPSKPSAEEPSDDPADSGDEDVDEDGKGQIPANRLKAASSMLKAATVDGEVTFGNFDAYAWCTASDSWKIYDGNNSNMWAPDVIYNTTMNKYCMYLSLNGEYQNSVVILLTADQIEGPYAYQGPVVYSGFSAQENEPINYKNTDLKYIIGDNAELPERYQKIKNISVDGAGKITEIGENAWADYWPHAIDPAVFYDDNGKLWMIYGSWSGGIFALELDETTGLRDYTVSYASDYDEKQRGVTSDPYFGKKIAGGYYVSGEGPYIEKIGNYYYLFMSYGFYAPNGGYSMRIFRSENPDGPYVDTKGTSAIFDQFKPNFMANYQEIHSVADIDTRGMRLMTYYQWDHMAKGEVAQGHNSAVVDDDGRAYVVYHTKFNDNSAAHELRVHELFQNKDGWILASPFAFANDEKLDYNASPTGIAGEYEILVGDYSLGYDKDSGSDLGNNYTGPLAEHIIYTFTADGKITKDGQDAGTWAVVNGQAYATVTIDGHAYSGVFAQVTKDSAGIKTMCFTGVDEQTGITLWGAKTLDDIAVIADQVSNPSYAVPEKVYGSFKLPATGGEGVNLYWRSANESLVSHDGKITELPESDTNVTFAMTMVYGDYYYQKDYTITVASKNSQTADGRYLVGEAYTDSSLTLPNAANPSMVNPFYITNTAGLELSGGVSIEFDVKHNGAVDVLGALFAFNGNDGKLYFTQGSYLGYNALGGWYDANLNNYTLVKDYISEAIAASGKDVAHVTIDLSSTGFAVYMDDKLAYDQSILKTDNGDGTLTDYINVLTWLQDGAPILRMGQGSWWEDRKANAVISNMKFYVNQANDEAVLDGVIEALEKQIPASTTKDINLPTEGGFGVTISWTSSHPEIIAADGKVTVPTEATEVTLTAEVSKGTLKKTATFQVLVKLPPAPSTSKNVVLERKLLELTSAAQIELIDNPFYGKDLESLIVDYDITFTEGGYKSGFDGIFAFYNSETTGRVSFQTNPYVCLNEMLPEGQTNVYLDINHPDKNNLAKDTEFGREYHVKIVIKKTECKIYLDGNLVVTADENTLTGNADFAELLAYAGKCDKFSWGVGNQQASFWGSELSTVKNISIRSNEYEADSRDEVVLADAPTVMDNPLFGKKLSEVVLDFKVDFAAGAFMNGWDGLLAFYQPAEGAEKGRVSIQTAPYICYNEMGPEDTNTWMDINNPDALEGANIEVPVTKLDREQIHHYFISISADEVIMEVDGEPVEQVKKGSAAASYQDILDYISGCRKFSWGVVLGENCFWGMEKCTLTDASVKGYYSEENKGEEEQKITAELHYPDGTVETKTLEKGGKLEKPVFEGEDANGKYGIIWYADEEKTELFDFDAEISEDTALYGSYYYYCEEPGENEGGGTTTVKTGIWVERIDDREYTGAAIKPVINVYDGTKKLKEKTDYKVSYSDNKKVSTQARPAKVTITPCGNYEKASKFSIHFNIVKRKITKENVTVSYKPEMNVKRNKQKEAVGQTQKITLKYGKLTVPAREYTVTYKKGGEMVERLTEAGNYQLVIKTKDISSFEGELLYDIVVTDKILASALKYKVAAQTYTGSPLTPDVKVTYKGKDIVAAGQQLSDFFDIEYKDNINAGTATVTLTAKPTSEYCGSKAVTFKINGTPIKKAAIEGFRSSIPYTGEAVTQNVVLKLNRGKADEKTLQSGTDYDIAYTANTKAGKVTMTITGKAGYSGTVKKAFTIGKIKMTDETINVQFAETASPLKVVQDKSGAKPAVKVTWGDTVLEQDQDYTVTYSANKAVGVNAKVTVKGIGNYTGTRKNALTFEIMPKQIVDESVTAAADDLKYLANGRYKAKLKVYDNGVKLSTAEYTVGAIENVTLIKDDAGNDTQCGTATVKLTGKKNYAGERTVTIRIKKALITSAKVTVNGKYYYANGEPICPSKDKLTVTIGSGRNKETLKQDEFEIVGYSNNTKKGTASLTIGGEGDYGGTKTVKFKILPKWMKRSN